MSKLASSMRSMPRALPSTPTKAHHGGERGGRGGGAVHAGGLSGLGGRVFLGF
jgi:hypothetical protein